MMGPDDDGAQLVETGGFRVDRGRALEKIRSYRRGDVGAVWLFMRAAAAAGAHNAVVRHLPDGFVVEFDGRSFDEKFLRDPYQALFAEEGGDQAWHWMALGLLHTFGPGLRLVSVESGPREARLRLSARDVGAEVVAAVPCEGTVTVVRVKQQGVDEQHWKHPRKESEQAAAPRVLVWGPLYARIERGYSSFTSPPPPIAGQSERGWAEGGVTGRLSVPEDEEEGLDLYIEGVYAGTVPGRGPVPFVGKVDSPALALDVSLASYAANENFTALMAVVDQQAGELVKKSIEEQSAALAFLAPALAADEVLRQVWDGRLRRSGHLEAAERYMSGAGPSSSLPRAEMVRRVVHAARLLVWLRRLALRRRPDDAWGGLLDTAPLALDADWRPTALGSGERIGF